MSDTYKNDYNGRICHMTDAHDQEDIRIFYKECRSLAEAGYNVYLVSRGEKKRKNGVNLEGVGQISFRRFNRIVFGTRTVYRRALQIDADIYHIHDPELLLFGLKLKKKGKKVVFDSHEDVAAQILDKKWIPTPFRKVTAKLYWIYETFVVKRLDAVVAATPGIASGFQNRARRVVIINNYPRLDDIQFHNTPFEVRERIACYTGGINDLRGEEIMTEAIGNVNATLVIAGDHEVENRNIGKGRILYIGQVSRSSVDDLYSRSRCGLLLYQYAANHYRAMPNKLFEYMAAGLPVVCSNFPLWKNIVGETEAGLCVKPDDVSAVSEAIQKIMDNPVKAKDMGRNGRKAVEMMFNWENEKRKLVRLYRDELLYT